MVWKQETEITREKMEDRITGEELEQIFNKFTRDFLNDLYLAHSKDRVIIGKCSLCKQKNVPIIGGYHKYYYCGQCLFNGIWVLDKLGYVDSPKKEA